MVLNGFVTHLEVDYLPPDFHRRVRVPFNHQAPTIVGPFEEDVFSHKDLPSRVQGLKGGVVGWDGVYCELGWDRDGLKHLVLLTIRESFRIRREASREGWSALRDMGIQVINRTVAPRGGFSFPHGHVLNKFLTWPADDQPDRGDRTIRDHIVGRDPGRRERAR